jgi:hypothetical protein
MRNVSVKSVEKIKTHILCSITFSRQSFRIWDNVEKYDRARQATNDNIIQRMRFACWVTKATDTHSKYIILIAFPWQQCLRDRASVLCYMYITCLVYPLIIIYYIWNILSIVESSHILKQSIKGFWWIFPYKCPKVYFLRGTYFVNYWALIVINL